MLRFFKYQEASVEKITPLEFICSQPVERLLSKTWAHRIHRRFWSCLGISQSALLKRSTWYWNLTFLGWGWPGFSKSSWILLEINYSYTREKSTGTVSPFFVCVCVCYMCVFVCVHAPHLWQFEVQNSKLPDNRAIFIPQWLNQNTAKLSDFHLMQYSFLIILTSCIPSFDSG